MPENQSAVGGELSHRGHDRRKFGDGAAAEIIAVGEAAGQDHGVGVAQRSGVVPDKFAGLAEVMGDGVPGVVVAIAAGKNDDAESHGENFSLAEAGAGQVE